MSRQNKIRILLIDDLPRLRNPDTGLPVFSGTCASRDDERVYERNFSISWIFEGAQIKRYYYSARHQLLGTFNELAQSVPYPNIVVFDYKLDRASTTRFNLERNPDAKASYADLDPFARGWDLAALPASWIERLAPLSTTKLSDRDGCYGGALIALLFSDFASVGIPQTVTEDHQYTNFFEWMLDIQLHEAFAYKNDALLSWLPLFRVALPLLRKQTLAAVRAGALVPLIQDILSITQEPTHDWLSKANTIRFSSGVGIDELPIEGLFLDKIYEELSDGRLAIRDSNEWDGDINVWLNSVLNECVGGANWNDVQSALVVAEKFIAAYSSEHYRHRRELSQLICSVPSDEARAQLILKHEKRLRSWGVDIAQLTTSPLSAEIGTNSGDAIPKILRPLNHEAESEDGKLGRYTTIALAVWSEMIWLGINSPATGRRLDAILRFLQDEDSAVDEIKDDIELSVGTLITQDEFDEIERFWKRKDRDTTSSAWLDFRARLGQKIHLWSNVMGATLLVPGSDGELPDIDPKGSGYRHDRINLIRDVLAPSPEKFSLWRERNDSQSDVDRPLSRLGPKESEGLSLTALLNGVNYPNGKGLKPGEGRLIPLFARYFGFRERHWPEWMKDGAKL